MAGSRVGGRNASYGISEPHAGNTGCLLPFCITRNTAHICCSSLRCPQLELVLQSNVVHVIHLELVRVCFQNFVLDWGGTCAVASLALTRNGVLTE